MVHLRLRVTSAAIAAIANNPRVAGSGTGLVQFRGSKLQADSTSVAQAGEARLGRYKTRMISPSSMVRRHHRAPA